MKLLKQALAAFGVFVVIAILVALVAPKAARAVVVTLVQVTNTVAAPAITQGVPTLASQMVMLFCGGSSCNSVNPGGQMSSSPYAVPSGQNLVITHVEITGIGTSGVTGFSLEALPCPGGGCTFSPPGWDVSNDNETHEFSISPGIVWPGGAALKPSIFFNGGAFIYGYLTAN